MGNTTMPTPVLTAGAGLCLLGGYLIGVVAGPDTPDRSTAVVDSYHASSQHLCLRGESVAELEGARGDGRLCGTWRSGDGVTTPSKGDSFRFVSLVTDPEQGDDPRTADVVIYGDVVAGG